MTKEDQIDEMAKYICNVCEMGFSFTGDCSEGGQDYYKRCTLTQETAKALYEEGYRKVPDGAVVLTPEERGDETRETDEIIEERNNLLARVGVLGREVEELKAKLEARLTCRFVKTAQKQAVQEFVQRLKIKSEMFLVAKSIGVYGEKPYVAIEKIDELLKEYE